MVKYEANGIKLCVVRSHRHKPALNMPALGMPVGVSGIVKLFGDCAGSAGVLVSTWREEWGQAAPRGSDREGL